MRYSALIIILCIACQSSPTGEVEDQNYPAFEAGKDYFQDKVVLEHAQNFTVSYHDNYKVVRTKVGFGAAAQDADSLSWERAFTDLLVLVQKGTPPPALTGELEGAHMIEIPVETIAGNADDAPTRFTSLGVAAKIVGLGHEEMYDLNLRKRFETGELSSIGASWHASPSLEVLLSIKPEVSLLTAASLTQSEGVAKTRELGLAAAPDFSWSETSFLGQLEWIKYDAVFLNAEAAANEFFHEIETRCDSLKNLVQNRPNKPGAMWGMHRKKKKKAAHGPSV